VFATDQRYDSVPRGVREDGVELGRGEGLAAREHGDGFEREAVGFADTREHGAPLPGMRIVPSKPENQSSSDVAQKKCSMVAR
jgi:hypothetical protein